MSRGTSLEMWQRICDLVLWANSSSGVNRAEVAERWGCTKRNVSHVIDVAHQFYGVCIESERSITGEYRYVLVDEGVFDLSILRKQRRKLSCGRN